MIRSTLFSVIDAVFDHLESRWESDRSRRATANLLIVIFLGTIVVVEAGRQGWLPSDVDALVPDTHFAAVSLAFTFFLILEIIGLVFALAGSVANSVGKQFEIFSLILLREAFKEFSNFAEPIEWEAIRTPVMHMVADAVGALIIFLIVAFYYRLQRHRRITADAEEQSNFVRAKKAIALLLLITFAAIGVHDLWRLVSGGDTYPFFDTFYTVLVFSDVLIVLISLRYSATFHVVFRNSGFALATVALRIALVAPAYVNASIGIGAALFAVGLTYAYNTFGTVEAPPHVETPRTAETPTASNDVETDTVILDADATGGAVDVEKAVDAETTSKE